MDSKDNIKYLFNSNHSAVKRLLEDISDEESLERGGLRINHIRWITGHIVSSAGLMVTLLGGKKNIPENWDKMFIRGAKFSDDSSVYPSMAELKAKMIESFEQRESALEKVIIEKLETEKQILPEWNTTPANALLFLCTHEFYHAGQIATLRTILGREQMFG
jgi:uncharacterized damage-inducible protein DinB